MSDTFDCAASDCPICPIDLTCDEPSDLIAAAERAAADTRAASAAADAEVKDAFGLHDPACGCGACADAAAAEAAASASSPESCVEGGSEDDINSSPSSQSSSPPPSPTIVSSGKGILPGHQLVRSAAVVAKRGKGGVKYSGQRFHFTYKGHLDLARLRSFFEVAGGGLKGFSAVHENGHASRGEGDDSTGYAHTHVLVWWTNGVCWSSASRWNIDSVHPNVKRVSTVVHFRRILQYHKKEPVGLDSAHYVCELPAGFAISAGKAGDAFSAPELIELLKKFSSWARVLADPELGGYIQRSSAKMSYVRQLYDHLEELNDPVDPLGGLSLFEWQRDLELFLTSPADSRSILWIVDEKGGCGKSSFARYYECKNPSYSLFFTGKDPRDMASAISKSRARRVFFYDIPRACDAHAVSYEFLEHLKDGVVFVAKYDSRMIKFRPPHLIVFSNHQPILCLTADRLSVYNIVDYKFVYVSGKKLFK